MGWKAIKEHYHIGHTVHVRNGDICIGSPYISDLIVISADGEIMEWTTGDDDLERYLREMNEDPKQLKELIKVKDKFERSIPVYTYQLGRVIEKRCEATGWPNVTHDGELMYDNTFSTDYGKVVRWAKENLEIGIRWAKERIEQLRKELAECEDRLKTKETELKELMRINGG